MISRPEYNCLYVALSKVGSTSILSVLGKLGVFRNADQKVPDYISHKHTQHLNAQEYKRILGEEDFERRFKFAIVNQAVTVVVESVTDLVCTARIFWRPRLRHASGEQQQRETEAGDELPRVD